MARRGGPQKAPARGAKGSGRTGQSGARPGASSTRSRPAKGVPDRAEPRGPFRKRPDVADRPQRGGQRHAELEAKTISDPQLPRPASILRGNWAWLCRPFGEVDLVEELKMRTSDAAKVHSPSVVLGRAAPLALSGAIDLCFARVGFRVWVEAPVSSKTLFNLEQWKKETKGFDRMAITAVVPDSDVTNTLSKEVADLQKRLEDWLAGSDVQNISDAPTLPKLVPWSEAFSDERAAHGPTLLVYALLTQKGTVLLGSVSTAESLSEFQDGRARMRVQKDAPSRAARKLEEALHWFGSEPGQGELCVDLGAAPGGWSHGLLARKCRVIAVDPALLRPDIAKHPKLTHKQMSAFEYEPPDDIDWLFCDMAWRPLEVAQLLAKWARRRWSNIVVSNIKLPMKRKVDMVARVYQTLADAGWTNIKMRQLYHDRDEITLTAVRGR